MSFFGIAHCLLRRLIGASLLGVLLVVMAGCGSKGSLTGKVTYNDTPLAKGARLTFISANDRAFSTTISTDDGSYSIDGLPVGEYKVIVAPPTEPNMPKVVQGGEQNKMTKDKKGIWGGGTGPVQSGKKAFSIPRKYIDESSTTAAVTVKSGKQVDVNIQLTD